MKTLTFEDFTYHLRRSDRRQTIGLTVDRDGLIVVDAPDDADLAAVETVLDQKRFWLYTRLAEKEQVLENAVHRDLASGQGFLYLGRSYRLRLVDPGEQNAPLRLHQGHFCLQRTEQGRGREHFVRWYTRQAERRLPERVELYRRRLQVEPAGVRVMDLGYHWGSCGVGGVLNFHWRVILAPMRVVDYVVVHEMVHLAEPNHTPEFWQQMYRVLPDFGERKRWLAEHGVELGV